MKYSQACFSMPNPRGSGAYLLGKFWKISSLRLNLSMISSKKFQVVANIDLYVLLYRQYS